MKIALDTNCLLQIVPRSAKHRWLFDMIKRGNWNLITADPDDNKFSDCAVAAGADFLVTYDRHFRVLADIEFPKIICVTLEELKTIVESQTDS